MKQGIFLLPGFLFGVGLAMSGMTNPHKIIGFLDVTGGRWDPTLLFVMAGALMVFVPLNIVIHRRSTSLFGQELPGVRGTGKVDGRLLAGAALFGLGWGIGGVCPGPALTDLALLQRNAFVFVLCMVTGMAVAQRWLGADAPALGRSRQAVDTGRDVPASIDR